MKVETLCTTDDPVDHLRFHQQIRENNFDTTVLPAFRPDRFINILTDDFLNHIEQLGHVKGNEIANLNNLLNALEDRIEFCHHGW